MIINGYLMSKDRKIAKIHDNQVLPLISELLPIYFYTNDNIIGWLESRTIDNSHPNAKRLKQFLKLSGLTDSEIAMRVNGAVITDTYWVCLEDDHLVMMMIFDFMITVWGNWRYWVIQATLIRTFGMMNLTSVRQNSQISVHLKNAGRGRMANGGYINKVLIMNNFRSYLSVSLES